MSKGYLKGGYQKKFIVQKASGNPIDADADYFVLRLDKDPHARVALAAYAESIKEENQTFAQEIKFRLAEGYWL